MLDGVGGSESEGLKKIQAGEKGSREGGQRLGGDKEPAGAQNQRKNVDAGPTR